MGQAFLCGAGSVSSLSSHSKVNRESEQLFQFCLYHLLHGCGVLKFSYISVMYLLCRYALLSNLLFLITMTGYLPTNAVRVQSLLSAKESAERQCHLAAMIATLMSVEYLVAWESLVCLMLLQIGKETDIFL